MAGFSIPFAWKVGALVFGLLSFVAGIGGVCVYLINYGESKAISDMNNASLKAENANLTKTLESIQNGIQNLQAEEDKIRNSGRENPPLGPAMSDSLNELRAERAKDSRR